MNALLETHIDLPLFARGKVRDTYQLSDDRLLMVATDRISAFDHVLEPEIPDKGKILTQLSLWWFGQPAVSGQAVRTGLADLTGVRLGPPRPGAAASAARTRGRAHP